VGGFSAILVALALQAVFFQFGGITSLGVNTVIMALPAVACYYIFAPLLRRSQAAALPGPSAAGLWPYVLEASSSAWP